MTNCLFYLVGTVLVRIVSSLSIQVFITWDGTSSLSSPEDHSSFSQLPWPASHSRTLTLCSPTVRLALYKSLPPCAIFYFLICCTGVIISIFYTSSAVCTIGTLWPVKTSEAKYHTNNYRTKTRFIWGNKSLWTCRKQYRTVNVMVKFRIYENDPGADHSTDFWFEPQGASESVGLG